MIRFINAAAPAAIATFYVWCAGFMLMIVLAISGALEVAAFIAPRFCAVSVGVGAVLFLTRYFRQ